MPPADPPASDSSLPGDPLSQATGAQPSYLPQPPDSSDSLPEDLRIPWSWPHFVVLFIFGVVSLMVVQIAFAMMLAPHTRLSSPQDIQRYFLSKPQYVIGTMLFWDALIFLFLYITIAALREVPFWKSLGWRKLLSTDAAPGNPFLYLLAGCGLYVLVALATATMKTPPNAPIEDLFKFRTTAFLFMAMAVFIAPIFEETVFRGYLYPLIAKSFGIVPGIVVTGVLFGLMHGYQLGWSWRLVSVLIGVGIIFTFVRARTGTVVASFLMHLGYNAMIAVTSIIATHGFTRVPPYP
ncbi:MAG TPA: type II CAAX endopeptidase family protein [Terriglobales bacterium]|nr:type II CAAX endopeptidase family protein [Terriglobales bacterium]